MDLRTLLSSLPLNRVQPTLTSAEIDLITGLKFVNGTPLVTPDNFNFIYEMTSLFSYITVEEVTKTVQGFVNATPRLITQADVIYSLSPFIKHVEKYLSETDKHRNRVVAIEGIEPCRFCKSKATITFEIQARSADEATDTITMCYTCGKKS